MTSSAENRPGCLRGFLRPTAHCADQVPKRSTSSGDIRSAFHVTCPRVRRATTRNGSRSSELSSTTAWSACGHEVAVDEHAALDSLRAHSLNPAVGASPVAHRPGHLRAQLGGVAQGIQVRECRV